MEPYVFHCTHLWTANFSVLNLFTLDTIFLFLKTKCWQSWQPRMCGGWQFFLSGGLFWRTVGCIGVGRRLRRSMLLTVSIFWVAKGRRNQYRQDLRSLFPWGTDLIGGIKTMEDQDGYLEDSRWGEIIMRIGIKLLSKTKFDHYNVFLRSQWSPLLRRYDPWRGDIAPCCAFVWAFSWRQVPLSAPAQWIIE